jgi:hypothetical protein
MPPTRDHAVLIVDVDSDGLPQPVVDAHADGYLRRDADTAEQLDTIMGNRSAPHRAVRRSRPQRSRFPCHQSRTREHRVADTS